MIFPADCANLRHVTVGDRLRALREAQGLTQEQVGEMADLARETINKIEGGRLRVGRDRAAKLGKAFGLSPDEFLTRKLEEAQTDRLEELGTRVGELERDLLSHLDHLGRLIEALSDRVAHLEQLAPPRRRRAK